MDAPSNARSNSSRSLSRRSCLAASLAGVSSLLAGGASRAAAALSPITVSRVTPDLMRIRMEISVKGNIKFSDNPLVSQKTTHSIPLQSTAKLDYEERPLRPRDAAADSDIVAAERFYHDATSTSQVNKTEVTQTLRKSMRHAMVRRETSPEVVYAENRFYTHDELGLLRSPVSSVSVEQFLPLEAVSQGDRYEIYQDALCSVLNVTSVDSGKVECEVVEVTEDAIRFRLEGDLEGSVEGVSTRQRLLGKMTYDRVSSMCTWFALAVHETREIGKAEPGFDVSATIRMVRKPMDAPVGLPQRPAAVDFSTPLSAEKLYTELQSREIGVGTMMNRNWRIVKDAPGSAILRLVQNDQSIAQCNLRPLAKMTPGKQWTLEAFRADVERSLGDQMTQLIEGDQRVSAQGLRILRVVANGEIEGVAIRWIMMHFSDDSGRRVQATFTMSGDQVNRFGGNDAQLADSLRFLEAEDYPPGSSSKPVAALNGASQRVVEIRESDLDGLTTSASDLF